MGKRSDFERLPHDLYPTPAKAVQPLIRYLHAAGVRTFAEPCCGNGDLVRHLEGYGLICAYRGDIATGQDALASDHYGDIDAIITNPPHSREVMHPMIAHFQRSAPMVWLLIDLDWVATLEAVPFLPRCSDVMIIGRVKWFPDSDYGSKDNFAWFRFAADHRGVTAIHNTRSKQRASVTPAPGEEFRYVLHAEVPRMAAEGWERLPALDGTHHGEYSALMRRASAVERLTQIARPSRRTTSRGVLSGHGELKCQKTKRKSIR
jgi:hypothetical protein